MKDIAIFKMWRHAFPTAVVLLTIAIIFLWPSIPLKGVTNWLRFFVHYAPQNYLYAAMAILSGIYAGVYVYNRKIARCCSVGNAKTGAGGSLIGIFLGACPACIPALGFLFPLSVTIALSRLGMIFLILSIAIMLFSIWRMGGFQRT